jgi:hypothetical protein
VNGAAALHFFSRSICRPEWGNDLVAAVPGVMALAPFADPNWISDHRLRTVLFFVDHLQV